ncbi:hypothetical protein VTI74DRAFT_1614 [Chaetomium olivicolor]
MPMPKLTILITGCSPGGMGAALAITLHRAGHRVFATARDPSKLLALADQGIETLPLDITSPQSIISVVTSLTATLSTPATSPPSLDILINNAAGSYNMPLADASLPSVRSLFETNVFAQLAVTQALLPLLLASPTNNPVIVNHTSVGSVAAIPFQGIYNASKAALAMLTTTLRLELAPFGVRVVEIKTAAVRTNIIGNSSFNREGARLPEGSIYAGVREVVEKAMSQENFKDRGVSAEEWAEEVVGKLLGGFEGAKLPGVIWAGESAMISRVVSATPCGLGLFEGMARRMTGLDVVEGMVKDGRT